MSYILTTTGKDFVNNSDDYKEILELIKPMIGDNIDE